MNFRKISFTVLLCSFTMASFAVEPENAPKSNNSSNQTEEMDYDYDGDYEAYDNTTASSSEIEALFNVSGEDIVGTAMKYLGRPYRSGMSGPTAFDCSGFTSFVYKNSNIKLTRCSRSQFQQGISVDKTELKKGDLVFFGGSRASRSVGHVGIVTDADGSGDFHFVHASRSGIKVDDFESSAYYTCRYIGARRILDY